VIDITPLNVTSIKVVVPELNISVQNASRHFETYMSDRSAVDQLKESQVVLSDVAGILKMLEIPGALLLAQDMVRLLDKIINTPVAATDFALSALSQAFVAMPCYIEYVVDRSQAIPLLTLEFINELKSALRDTIIFEHQLVEYSLPTAIQLSISTAPAADLSSLVPRLRQMYQAGLVGLIREENLQLKMQLMHRSMSRLAVAAGSSNSRTLWRLGEAVLEAMLSKDLALTFTRKRILSLLESELRKYEQNPDTHSANANLLLELVYLVNVSGCTHQACSETFAQLSLPALKINDRLVQKEKAIMHGPNAETIITMVQALREDLAHSKEILEIASQDDGSGNPDLGQLISVFSRTSDILAVVGLSSPSQTLAKMSKDIQAIVDAGAMDSQKLLEIADGLLYVESSLANLSRLDLNFEATANEEDKRRLMAKSQLSEAQAIVIKEAQVGIAEAKKDIDSFIESNFEVQHISNVVANLASIKGGLAILGMKKAEAVVASCIKFIEATVQQGVNTDSAQSVLETMADALIALEYYLSEVELHGDAPQSVLAVAEQSLAALGFPVTK
jgi:hypothetical protein